MYTITIYPSSYEEKQGIKAKTRSILAPEIELLKDLWNGIDVYDIYADYLYDIGEEENSNIIRFNSVNEKFRRDTDTFKGLIYSIIEMPLSVSLTHIEELACLHLVKCIKITPEIQRIYQDYPNEFGYYDTRAYACNFKIDGIVLENTNTYILKQQITTAYIDYFNKVRNRIFPSEYLIYNET